jgi:hypothetical protein
VLQDSPGRQSEQPPRARARVTARARKGAVGRLLAVPALRAAVAGFVLLLIFFLLTAALIVGGEVVSASSCATPGSAAEGGFEGREQAPVTFRELYVGAADRYGLGPRGPAILAAIHKIESDFGQNMGPSSAGAIGQMQFMPSTWHRFGLDADGDGRRDPYSAPDAIYSAARYLRASGAPADWYAALFAYNHADWYVQDVFDQAELFGDTGAIVQVECTAESGAADLERAVKLYEPREYRMLPRWAMAPGYAPQAVDARIYANALYLLRAYDLRATAAREPGHASHGDGQALDLVPANATGLAAWERTAERAARDLGWTPGCGSSGVAPACPLSPAIRFIGYDGYPNHGAGHHLHISWQSSSGGSAALAPPAAWVMAFASAGRGES